MPGDDTISLARYTGRGSAAQTRLPTDRGPRQPMRGFDDAYTNIVDYIVRITHRIWEAREVDYIADTYAPDAQVFDDYGLQIGSAKIVADTHHTTGAFSDIVLDAEEVIWAGDQDIGYHTSHRVRIRGTNDGPSRYGPATGRQIDFVCIANCVALGNDIFLEHVNYNTAAMLAQLGHEPRAIAASLAADPPPGWPRDAALWRQLRMAARPDGPLSLIEPVEGFDPDAFVRALFDSLWNRGDDSCIATAYDADVRFEGPGQRSGVGHQAYRAFIDEWRGALDDIALTVDEVYWMAGEAGSTLVSVRWSLDGTHSGPTDGPFGTPTGTSLQLWGITQLQIRKERVSREWTLFNELDVMMQAARAAQSN